MATDTETSEILTGVRPLSGQIVPVKTVQETRAKEEFADAYVVEVNMKSAAQVIKVLDSTFARDPSLSLQHLRRFAKRDALPEHLKPPVTLESSTIAPTIFVLISPPLPDKSTLQTVLAPFAPIPIPSKDKGNVETTTETATSTPAPPTLNIQTTRVPLQPPINQRQAEHWTRDLWPTTFNPAAHRGMVAPPPSILNSTRESIQPRAGRYLSLARKIAQEVINSGRGRGVGAVIVDPEIEIEDDNDWMNGIVAVAGDARYARREGGAPSLWESATSDNGTGPNPACKKYDADLEGGPELHAMMRGIDMVASRRRVEDFKDTPAELSSSSSSLSSSLAPELTPLERHFLYAPPAASRLSTQTQTQAAQAQEQGQKRKRENEQEQQGEAHPSDPNPPCISDSNTQLPSISTSRILPRSQGGYLCTGLDVYITHEPCLSCCMGMLLSRFRAVIFPRRGRMAMGGLASEPVVSPVPDSDDEEEHPTTRTGTGENEREKKKPETEGKEGKEEERNYYGLHWRKELNWRALGFEFVEEDPTTVDDDEYKKIDEDLRVEVAFHA
ncbi:hypothetical protein VTN00DRAFT_7641 [Thermoascus crustaceus]|uniref:uncharacterized protein n=1 Tax=Thermoascus crustaceus TaxID=5088 RepID=UPI00374225DB